MNNLLPINSFYDELAIGYDEMISFDNTIQKKKKLLKTFINLKTKTAADIGCGTGVDSIALALNGLNVSAFDPSAGMLKVAESNSKKMNVSVNFQKSTAEQITAEFNDKFDLVVSLGNTFANIPEDKFPDSIKRCYDILKPGGQVLIQILNYKKILADKQRILNITEGKNNFFIRFYDFNDAQVVFNLLLFSKHNISDYKLSSTEIYPYRKDDFESVFQSFGVNDIQFYGDLKLNEFQPNFSKDLFIRVIIN